MRSYFIKQFMMSKTTFHTDTKGGIFLLASLPSSAISRIFQPLATWVFLKFFCFFGILVILPFSQFPCSTTFRIVHMPHFPTLCPFPPFFWQLFFYVFWTWVVCRFVIFQVLPVSPSSTYPNSTYVYTRSCLLCDVACQVYGVDNNMSHRGAIKYPTTSVVPKKAGVSSSDVPVPKCRTF